MAMKAPFKRHNPSVRLLAAAVPRPNPVIAELDYLTLGQITREAAVRSRAHCGAARRHLDGKCALTQMRMRSIGAGAHGMRAAAYVQPPNL
jgi:hypothetical protein